MNKAIKVSVIVPCYNQAQFLDECLTSLLNQTFTDWECIIVNDGSPDNTEEVAKKWIDKDDRFIYYKKVNGGPASARNFGIKNANGEFIVALDADDILEVKFLKSTCEYLIENSKAGAVTTYLKCFGSSEIEWKPKGGNIVSFLASNQAIQSSMFRRSIWEKVGGYDEKTSVGFFEDWDFWILLTSQGWTIGVVPELLLKYRRFGNSNQDNAMKNFDVVLEYYVNRHKALYEKYLTEIIIHKNHQVMELNDKVIYHERLLSNLEKNFFFKALRYLLYKFGKL